MKLKEKIELCISEYLENIDIEGVVISSIMENFEIKNSSDESFVDKISDSIVDNINEALDSDSISKEIYDKLSLDFMTYNYSSNTSGDLVCPECYREYGFFTSQKDGQIEFEIVMKNGVVMMAV